jgi:large subunit ribosomal protein L5e
MLSAHSCSLIRTDTTTDYYGRKRLVTQDKNKYNSPKYRLVVRFSNKDVTCQIVYSKLEGDHVLTAAYSHELPRYGLSVGLTNYAACYSTGLLVARRLLNKLKLDDKYKGNQKIDGTEYHVEALEDGPRPFRCFLDVGLTRTTTGHRLFACLKGAVDGGLDIPHSVRRFPGYNEDKKTYNAQIHRDRIFGKHVAEFMKSLQADDEEEYKQRFSAYVKAGVTHDKVEKLYQSVHAAIRKDPAAKPTEKKDKYKQPAKVNHAKSLVQRRNRLLQIKKAYLAKAAAGGDE